MGATLTRAGKFSPASVENSPPSEEMSTESGGGNMADGALTFVRAAEWQRLQFLFETRCNASATPTAEDTMRSAPCSRPRQVVLKPFTLWKLNDLSIREKLFQRQNNVQYLGTGALQTEVQHSEILMWPCPNSLLGCYDSVFADSDRPFHNYRLISHICQWKLFNFIW